MVLVRIVFHAKIGRANQVVASMKQGIEMMRGSRMPKPRHVRIFTDLSGQFDTVVEELEYESLDEFLAGQTAMFADPKWQEAMRDNSMADNILGGSKEYYTVEYEE